MNGSHYCLECGAPLTPKVIDKRQREVCEQCGWVNWEQVKLSAGCLVEMEERVLLVQRAFDPWHGCWHMPSGFVEVDEDPMRAAEREIREETGLTVAAGELVNAYLYQDDPRGNGVILIYRATVVVGNLSVSSETLDCRFFSQNEVTGLELAGVSGRQEVSEWLSSKTDGNRHD